MRSGRHLLVGALLVLGYYMGLPDHVWQGTPRFQPPPAAQAAPSPDDEWQYAVASDAQTLLVHAASLVELPDGRVRGFWFAGTREGAADVAIHSAVFDPVSGGWTPEKPVLEREWLASRLGIHIRKLGNAVASLDEDGRLRLFAVAVSFGGWAASRIVVLESDDLGETFEEPRLLVTSPFLNISNLVKGVPVRFTDGSLGLPIYHEFLGKFGEVLRVDRENRVLAKQRIGYGRGAIQPVLFIDGPDTAAALLRNEQSDHSLGVWRSTTTDAGQHWGPLTPAGLLNPSAAVGGVPLSPGHWLAALNCNPAERDDLCLMETTDAGIDWRRVKTFHDRAAVRGEPVSVKHFTDELAEELARTGEVEDAQRILGHARRNKCRDGECEFQYDYPFLLRTRNGDIHMLYTWNKTMIRHAWWRAPQGDTP